MSLWRQITHGLGVLTNRTAADQDVADEVAHYLEQSAAALEARGLSPAEARRVARIELGNVTVVRDQVREYGWESVLGTAITDLKHSVRRLLHKPGFTTVCILTLVLGIGATSAIFSVLDGVLLKALPYPHPEQLVAVWQTAPGVNIADLNISPSLYFVYSEENRVFQDIGIWTDGTSSVTGLAEPENVPELMATNRLLPTLGVQPALGRPFRPSDDDPKSPREP